MAAVDVEAPEAAGKKPTMSSQNKIALEERYKLERGREGAGRIGSRILKSKST